MSAKCSTCGGSQFDSVLLCLGCDAEREKDASFALLEIGRLKTDNARLRHREAAMMHAILAAALTGATESKDGQPTLSVNLTYERLSAMNDAIEATLADNARLRALVKAAEWAQSGSHEYGDWRACPWCDDESRHLVTCPAFTPEGVVR